LFLSFKKDFFGDTVSFVCDHVRIHIFNRPINDEPTEYIDIQTKSCCPIGQYAWHMIEQRWRFPGLKPTEPCSVRPQMVDRGALSMESCQVIIRKAWPWNIVYNMFWECHAPCTLNTSFVDFEKQYGMCIIATTKDYIFRPYPTLQSKVVDTSIPSFLIVFMYYYYWACSCSKYSWNNACWTLSNNQSTNQSKDEW
jgi:hypothetical protein